MSFFVAVVEYWILFPVACIIFAVAIVGVWRVCAGCWRDYQFAKESALLLGDKPGADRLLPPSLGPATTTSVSPSDPPFDWAA